MDVEACNLSSDKKNSHYIMKGNYRVYAVDQPDKDDSHIELFYDFVTKLTDDWYFYER